MANANYFYKVFVKSIIFSSVLAGLLELSLGQGTTVGFYSQSCPDVELIVGSAVRSRISADRSIAAGLLKLHYADCFVRGCDGSILIDGPDTEKTAPPNLNLRGYEVIDDIKQQLENQCPGVVSCADILALAAREAVVQMGGPTWAVPTGRRDGRISSALDASKLPAPFDSIDVLIQKFGDKGLNMQDLVTLVGGHTIGYTSCRSFEYRLYNYASTGGPDPTIDPSFLNALRVTCPADGSGGSNRVVLDNGSENLFDNSFFKNLVNSRGVLESDQRLWTNASTTAVVQSYLGIGDVLGSRFSLEFVTSILKMSNIQVRTGSDGEIRRACSAVN